MFIFIVIIFILTINYTQQYKLGKLLIVFISILNINYTCLHIVLYRVHLAMSGVRTQIGTYCKFNYHTITTMAPLLSL